MAAPGDRFVVSAADIRTSIRVFNQGASTNEGRARKLLFGTTYWVYDPDAEQFGPGKFVGLAEITFNTYERRRNEVTGAQTRAAIERALDDSFERRPSWRGR